MTDNELKKILQMMIAGNDNLFYIVQKKAVTISIEDRVVYSGGESVSMEKLRKYESAESSAVLTTISRW